MRRQLALLIAVASFALLVVAGPVQAQAGESTSTGTWRGQVVAHEGHYDYKGLACPVESEVCILVLVTYRIVPVTEQAKEALPRVAGEEAELTGRLVSRSDGYHHGYLLVSRVS